MSEITYSVRINYFLYEYSALNMKFQISISLSNGILKTKGDISQNVCPEASEYNF